MGLTNRKKRKLRINELIYQNQHFGSLGAKLLLV